MNFRIHVGLLTLLVFFTMNCSTRQTNRPTQQSQLRPGVIKPKETSKHAVITLDKKPRWLLIGGIEDKDTIGGDIITVGGNSLKVPGLEFEFENEAPEKNPITFSVMRGNQIIIYHAGKGTITNLITMERIFVPPSEDPRSEEDRKNYLNRIRFDARPSK